MLNRIILKNRLATYVRNHVTSKPGTVLFNEGILSLSFTILNKLYSDASDKRSPNIMLDSLPLNNFSKSLEKEKAVKDCKASNINLEDIVCQKNLKHLLESIKHDWTSSDKEKFLFFLSKKFFNLKNEILLNCHKMSASDLKRIITFLESLDLSKDSYSPLREIYIALEKKMESDNNFDTKNKDAGVLKSSQAVVSDILMKFKKCAESTCTNSERIEILKEAKNLQVKDVTPTFLIDYYTVLDKVNAEDLQLEEVKLDCLHDAVISVLRQDQNKFLENLPNFLFIYANTVSDGKEEYSDEILRLIIENLKKGETLSEDQHVIALKALNILFWPGDDHSMNYLQYVINNHLLNHLEVLDSIENLNVFLESLRITDFNLIYKEQCDNIMSTIKNLSVLQNEEIWKNVCSSRLQGIIKNLTCFQICPSFLSPSQYLSENFSKPNLLSEGMNDRDFSKLSKDGTESNVKLASVLEDLEFSPAVDDETSEDEMIEILQDISISMCQALKTQNKKKYLKIFNFFSGTSRKNMTTGILVNYYKILDKISADNPRLESVQLQKKFNPNHFKEQEQRMIHQIPDFLTTYAKVVDDGKEWFHKGLVKANLTALMTDETVSIEQHFKVLQALNLLKTGQANYVHHILNLIFDNKNFLNNPVNLHTILEALGPCGFHSKRNRRWPYLKSFIERLPILKTENKLKDVKPNHIIHIAKNLVLFGIYSKALITVASQKVNDNPLDDPKSLSTLLILHQAIHALHPSFNRPFLSEKSVKAIDEAYFQNDSLQDKLNFIADVKSTLELETYENDVFITNCYTKLGLKIDLILALNESDEPFSFSAFVNDNKKCFLEDISLPDNYELVIVCLFEDKNCLRSPLKLDTEAHLKIKTFEAMGFVTVAITQNEWTHFENGNKGSHFWKKIIEGSKCKLPEELLEQAREPLLY